MAVTKKNAKDSLEVLQDYYTERVFKEQKDFYKHYNVLRDSIKADKGSEVLTENTEQKGTVETEAVGTTADTEHADSL